MELLGLQEIVYQKNLKALDLSEKHWNNADEHMISLAVPQESFNIRSKKINAPIEQITPIHPEDLTIL